MLGLRHPDFYRDRLRRGYGVVLKINAEPLCIQGRAVRHGYETMRTLGREEKPTDNFGFGKGVKVKVLAIGDLDKDQYARSSTYTGKEYTVYSSTHPIGGCWY